MFLDKAAIDLLNAAGTAWKLSDILKVRSNQQPMLDHTEMSLILAEKRGGPAKWAEGRHVMLTTP